MTDPTRSTRRQIITAVLLVFALIGAVVRWLAPEPSLARNLGTLLMVLWLPIVGNIIAWLIQRAKTPRHLPPGFAPDAPFETHAHIRLTLLPPDTPRQSRPIRAGRFVCALAVGPEAFTVRLQVPADGEPVPELPCTLPAQFLRPELAGARLTPGTRFALLAGRTVLGSGEVVSPPRPDPAASTP